MKKEQQTKKEKKKIAQRKSSTSIENTLSSKITEVTFDWNGLLYRLMGDEGLAKEIINDFFKQIPKNLMTIKKALNDKDLVTVQREAHIIKGASGNVGALVMQEIAEQIEIAGEAKDLVQAESFVAKLDTQLEILKKKLTQTLS